MAGPAHDAGVLRLTETGRVALRTKARGSLKRDPREKKTKRAGTGPGQCSAGAACGLRNRRLALPGGPRRPPARRLPRHAAWPAPPGAPTRRSSRGGRKAPRCRRLPSVGGLGGAHLHPPALSAGSMALFWPRDELSSHSAALRPESRSGPAGHGSVPFWGLPPTCFSHRVFSLNKFLKSPKVFK